MAQPQIAPIDTVPVNLTGTVVQGPDGRPWIQYEISLGLTKHTVTVPIGTAKQLPALWTNVTQQCLTQLPAAGLVLPASALLLPNR